LYIGTERHIYRLVGDGPDNYRKPEIALNQVGIVNQEVMQIVYSTGTAAGAMWLTPTRRVMWSDLNSFRDVGTPIQDVLNTINSNAIDTCNALSLTMEGLDLYMLAIPTGTNTEPDTLCVYNIPTRAWFIWKTADAVTAQLYNVRANGSPQALFASLSRIFEWTPSSTQDEQGASGDPQNFDVIIRTSWLGLDAPIVRKTLNEMEIMTPSEDMTLTIQGSSNAREFVTPAVVCAGEDLTNNAFGESKVRLAGRTSKDRFYQFEFTDTGSDKIVLRGYSVELSPLHRI
jgi:hypothetical protein